MNQCRRRNKSRQINDMTNLDTLYMEIPPISGKRYYKKEMKIGTTLMRMKTDLT